MPTVSAHIVVRGAAEAAGWYERAFGARELSRVPVPDGRLMSVQLAFGDSVVSVADEFPEMGVLSPASLGGTPVALSIHTVDAGAAWERALAAGAEVHVPLRDAFWGERHGQVVDPFGHRWSLAQRVRDVPHDEIVREAAAAFGG